ncbi:hypothetical protein GCM10007377_11090 [Galliscardovia ingluviei]|uniref:Nuclease SbcCD subunit C n=1 Tax=Galliscardovia ingluviei TaxID=1769422 RepID=A0A8J3AKI5_9BIFI|nr:AAA family ATPase [Galliscardovia ingluviei]GGI14469.1 hypothetical protein GCM10007377_11090 [Galliscardovia ingluviei]
MIKTIRLRDCATYSPEGVSIEDCKKVNFIYGPNGSGKTTISNFLHNPSSSQYSKCEIEYENSAEADILVYNRYFREKNLVENIPGVFTLGHDTIEKTRELGELKKKRSDKNNMIERLANTLKEKKEEKRGYEDEFKDTAWLVILKSNESDFQSAFSGLRNNKNSFRDEVLRHYKSLDISSETREKLVLRAKAVLVNNPEKYSNIPFSSDSLTRILFEIENSDIWKKKVIGNKDIPIGKLIEELDIANWVSQGRSHIRERTCPFCQQPTITDEIKQQLEAYFSGEYEQAVNQIKSFADQYDSYSKNLLEQIIALKEKLISCPVAGIDTNELEKLTNSLIYQISNNLVEIRSKEKEPGKIALLSDTSKIINSLLELVSVGNSNINKHNEIVDNHKAEKERLINDIWNFVLHENKTLIDRYLSKIDQASKAIDSLQNKLSNCAIELKKIEKDIIDVENGITSIQPTVNEINRSLQNFGFTNFRIVPSDAKTNTYQIQRQDGTLASSTLSEGEGTFISFLYFLQLAKGSIDASKVSNRRILVIDDPISSLDSTVLYFVSSLVKNIIKDVREGGSEVEQIFILTHNVFFYKEIAFIDRRADECNDIHHWILWKNNNISTIRAYGTTNPIKTSYELLWEELKKNEDASIITTQNTMRRILEIYFKVIGGVSNDDILEHFQTIEEKMTCRSLISWVNDGSHTIPDDLYASSFEDSIDRYKEVFKKVFSEMGHKAHYEMMMKDKK